MPKSFFYFCWRPGYNFGYSEQHYSVWKQTMATFVERPSGSWKAIIRMTGWLLTIRILNDLHVLASNTSNQLEQWIFLDGINFHQKNCY